MGVGDGDGNGSWGWGWELGFKMVMTGFGKGLGSRRVEWNVDWSIDWRVQMQKSFETNCLERWSNSIEGEFDTRKALQPVGT